MESTHNSLKKLFQYESIRLHNFISHIRTQLHMYFLTESSFYCEQIRENGNGLNDVFLTKGKLLHLTAMDVP
jgi:hypothetical protein